MEAEILAEFKQHIEEAIKSLRGQLAKLRTGRANLAILDGVRVDYYGTPTLLNQLANLAVTDARLITIKPWDRSVIAAVEKAIMVADVGITPQNAGDLIRLPIPPLNEERRRDLVKQAKGRGEDAKLSVRNSRRDTNELLKELEKGGEISEDDLRRDMEQVQKLTDEAMTRIDQVIKDKEKDILED